MKARSAVATIVLAFAIPACGPALWIPPPEPQARVSVEARMAASSPPPPITIATSSVEPEPVSLVTVDLANGSSGRRVNASGGAEGSIAIGGGSGGAVAVDLRSFTIDTSHIVVAGAADLLPPTSLVFACSDIPADAVVVSATLDFGAQVAGDGSMAAGGGVAVVGGGRGTIRGGARGRGRGRGHVVVVNEMVPSDGPSTRAIRGGRLVLEAPDGRQWTVEIDGGDMDAILRAAGNAAAGANALNVVARIHVRVATQTRLARAGAVGAGAVANGSVGGGANGGVDANVNANANGGAGGANGAAGANANANVSANGGANASANGGANASANGAMPVIRRDVAGPSALASASR